MISKKDLAPIYGLWHKPFWQTTLFYMLVGFLVSLVFAIFIWWLIRKYIYRKIIITPWQKALIDLEGLKKLYRKNKINSQAFYLSLTKIIKNYLGNRFGYDLFGCTDSEVILFLEKKGFNKNLLENITQMFESMQYIKFAAKSAAEEMMEKDLQRSFVLIEKTIPKPSKK